MKELYTIGETAALMGITTRTLRYYNSMGLISPSYTDPDTGYRYYSFKQFHYIDRIKYLQSFGLSLESIKEVILSGSVETLLSHLNEQREKQRRAIEESEKSCGTSSGISNTSPTGPPADRPRSFTASIWRSGISSIPPVSRGSPSTKRRCGWPP